MKYGSLYLIGPIRGTNYDESTSWRDQVRIELESSGVSCFSPMRGKQMIKEVLGNQKIVAKKQAQASAQLDGVQLTSTKGINLRDYFDVRRCDGGFVNFLGSDRISKGSILECGGFIALGKPLIVCMEEDNAHNHPLLNEHAFICRSIKEGIWYAKQLLTPDCTEPYVFHDESKANSILNTET